MKENSGVLIGTYTQLLIAVGQFARLYVTTERISVRNLQEILFSAITKMKGVEALLQHFQIRGSPQRRLPKV